MGSWVLIYDGACDFCRRLVERASRYDSRGEVVAVPFQAADLARYGISRQAAEEAMHLVSPAGVVWRGAGAAGELIKLLPRLRPLAWLFRFPGAMLVAEPVYRWVARRRHRFGCDSPACRRGRRLQRSSSEERKSR